MTQSRTIIQKATDLALESTLLSYTALGYKARKSRFDALPRDLSHVKALITGANSGTGFACAQTLAKRSAHVIMVCRNEERGQNALEKIRKSAPHPERVRLKICDISILEQVHALCDALIKDKEEINRLVLNAGVLLNEKSFTDEGFESTFATNVLGGFCLVQRLVDAMPANARIISVTSGGMYTQRLHLGVLQGKTDRYDGTVAYAQTKRAQTILTEMWAERFKKDDIIAHAMHPGWSNTPGIEKSLPGFHKALKLVLRSPEQGADTLSWLCATSEDLGSGKLWFDREPRKTHIRQGTKSSETERRALYSLCEGLCQRSA